MDRRNLQPDRTLRRRRGHTYNRPRFGRVRHALHLHRRSCSVGEVDYRQLRPLGEYIAIINA